MKMKLSKSAPKELNKQIFHSTYSPATYVSTLINKVNEWSYATRPATVGDLARKIFPNYISNTVQHSPEQWKEYYLENYKDKYDLALLKLKSKFEAVKLAFDAITDEDLQGWLDDFLFTKTFDGLFYQDAILNDISHKLGKELVAATQEDESIGIDGFIDGIAYSVKPESYKQTQASQHEKIEAVMIYYKELDKDNLEYEIEEQA